MPSSFVLLLSLLFWLSLAYLLYVEVGYLLLLWLISRFRPASLLPPTGYLPNLTVLVATRNQEQVIAARLDNLLAQGSPSDLLEIICAPREAQAEGLYNRLTTLVKRLKKQVGDLALLQ